MGYSSLQLREIATGPVMMISGRALDSDGERDHEIDVWAEFREGPRAGKFGCVLGETEPRIQNFPPQSRRQH